WGFIRLFNHGRRDRVHHPVRRRDPLMKHAASLLAGLLFGFGLALSQMTNPAKVIGFLNVAGPWDPTLAFVLAGAVLVTLVSFRFNLRRPRPVLAKTFRLPTRHEIDAQLIGGAALFGVV